MTLKIGDTFFNRDGVPASVTGRDPRKEELILEREGANFEKARRYGFVNGLDSSDRQEFNSILDSMREKPEVRERVDFLYQKIEMLKEDPRKNVLTRYLEGEMAHIMNSEGIYPRVYRIDEAKT